LRFIRLLVLIMTVAVGMGALEAQAQGAGVIREVVIQGNQRIELETIRSYLLVTEGDGFERDRMDRSLKALFATGLFADVSIRREGDALVVRLVENPVINRLAFEGNKKLKDEVLQAEILLKPRVVYTRTKVQNDVKRIQDLYRRSGRFAATVEPKLIQLEQNRVDLVFEIDEGPKTGIRRINFVGNKEYGDSKLREVLLTKEERWWRIFSAHDSYDPDRLTYDRELLRRFYLKNGYADFRVASVVAELAPSREDFFVSMTLEEGERYRIGKVTIDATLPNFNAADYDDRIMFASGDWYNADKIEDSVQKLTDAVGTKGYAFVEVKPRIERDREKKEINVTFDVQEGARVFVERIDIAGNVRTLDKVLRREFRLVEGDAFNSAKLRRSRQRLQNLGFFEKVEVNHVPSDETPDRTIIKVDVQEKSTGELSFGIGWGTQTGGLVQVGVRERNLLGKGQDLKANFTLAQKLSQADLSFTEPYFLDRPLAAGADAFAINKNLQKESSYNERVQGGALRLGYGVSEYMAQSLKYTLKEVELTNIKSTASKYVKEQEGSAVTSSVGQILLYDRRDSRMDPKEGYFLRLSNDVAGLGGTEKYLRSGFDAGYFYPVMEDVTFTIGGKTGYIFGYGNKLRIADHYFVGGESLRGFAPAGVSPRDANTRDALGGVWFATGSTELLFPIGLPNEFGITGKVFTDIGTIGEPDTGVGSDVLHSNMLRVSAGTGVNWKSPMGPMSIDLGYPLRRETFDRKEIFRFNFGTRF
jgi:outer membrane protein insertion porin family